jgi:hypothetical protein
MLPQRVAPVDDRHRPGHVATRLAGRVDGRRAQFLRPAGAAGPSGSSPRLHGPEPLRYPHEVIPPRAVGGCCRGMVLEGERRRVRGNRGGARRDGGAKRERRPGELGDGREGDGTSLASLLTPPGRYDFNRGQAEGSTGIEMPGRLGDWARANGRLDISRFPFDPSPAGRPTTSERGRAGRKPSGRLGDWATGRLGGSQFPFAPSPLGDRPCHRGYRRG